MIIFFQRLYKSPLFFLFSHVCLIALFAVFTGYFMFSQKVYIDTNQTIEQIQQTEGAFNAAQAVGGYFDSETFQIRYIKEVLGKKLKGEQVIDTSQWFGVSTTSSITPAETPGKLGINTVQAWMECMLGVDMSCLTP
jgi:hypothetical protein